MGSNANSTVKSLETLSELKGYHKRMAAKELDDINQEIIKIEDRISTEKASLNKFFEEIRASRAEKEFLTSDSYEREFNHIKIIKEEVEKLNSLLLEQKEEARIKKQQIVREMNKEKLYTTVATGKKDAQKIEINKRDDDQLQEQWLSNNYKNE